MFLLFLLKNYFQKNKMLQLCVCVNSQNIWTIQESCFLQTIYLPFNLRYTTLIFLVHNGLLVPLVESSFVYTVLTLHQCGPGSIPRLGVTYMYVGSVCCWFLSLLREVFLWVLWFPPLLKYQHFQIPIQSGLLSSTLS